jgi:hypothetical protein
MIRKEWLIGYFVGFEITGDTLFEFDGFRRKEGGEIKALAVREILKAEVGAR